MQSFYCEIFFSVFYVFYEQYLTVSSDALRSIGFSLIAVFIVTLVLTGFNIFSAVVVIIIVTMVVTNLAGFMIWWSITLNAVSVVNLVVVSIISKL